VKILSYFLDKNFIYIGYIGNILLFRSPKKKHTIFCDWKLIAHY